MNAPAGSATATYVSSRRRLSTGATVKVSVEVASAEDAESLVQSAKALPSDSITNAVNSEDSNAGVQGVTSTGVSEPEANTEVIAPPEPKVCKPWCEKHTHNWNVKCAWENCESCEQCVNIAICPSSCGKGD